MNGSVLFLVNNPEKTKLVTMPFAKGLGFQGKMKAGVTLLEIVVAIAIIALMATIVLPNLFRLRPHADRKLFVSHLNTLVGLAWQQAVASRTTFRIDLDLVKHTMKLQQDSGKKDTHNNPIYSDVRNVYVPTSYTWSPNIQIKEIFIDGIDEMHKPGRQTTEEFWFFVYPDGSTQEVVINFFDTADKSESEAGSRYGLVVNPFTAKLNFHESFQTP